MSELNSRELEQVSQGELLKQVALAGHIPRLLGNPDVGIDGDIEFCDKKRATGARIAFQLKAGPSYISSITDMEVKILIETRHIRYWCCVNLPVLLIYYHLDTGSLYWCDLKAWLLASRVDLSAQQRVIPVPRQNLIPSQCTDQWQRILSSATPTQLALQENYSLQVPELALFRDPRHLDTSFAFTLDRFVIAERIESDSWTMIEAPQELAPPAGEITTTLLTFFSLGRQSTGAIRTQVGWPEVAFDTIINDTIPIEVALLYGSFQIRLDPGSEPVKLFGKGYGFIRGA